MLGEPKKPSPILSVSCAVWNKDHVLLIKRAKEPFKGYWSLPGGSVEPGETVLGAVAREVLEETRVTVTTPKLVTLLDSINMEPSDQSRPYHFVIAVHTARLVSGNASASSDAAECAWSTLENLADFKLTPSTANHIRSCWALLD